MRTLREEWQVLRGLPERESPTIGDEPCVEVCDRQRLCPNPLVSVICLVWGHEKWLDDCISGMVNQETDFEYEILLCEDHSPDRCREICLTWQVKHPDKIRIVSGEKNLGVWKNASLGFRESRGKYLAFLEGDDYWTDSQKLQKQINLVCEKGYRFVVAWNDLLDDATGVITRQPFPAREVVTLGDYKGGYYHTSTYLYEKKLGQEIRAYCKFVKPYDTVVFLLALGLGVEIGVLPKKVSVYRQTGTGIYTGNTGAKNALVGIQMFMGLKRFGPKNLRTYCRYSYECALLDYFIHSCRAEGLRFRHFLALAFAIVNLTFRINPRHVRFLWCSAVKSIFVSGRKGRES